jgi:hypothetical protein
MGSIAAAQLCGNPLQCGMAAASRIPAAENNSLAHKRPAGGVCSRQDSRQLMAIALCCSSGCRTQPGRGSTQGAAASLVDQSHEQRTSEVSQGWCQSCFLIECHWHCLECISTSGLGFLYVTALQSGALEAAGMHSLAVNLSISRHTVCIVGLGCDMHLVL